MAHTKTPWKLNYACDGIESAAGGGGITLMTDLFGEPDRTEEGKANAAHIVRCVNAHDALISALESVIDGWDNWSDKGRIERAMDAARVVLKTAKGD